MSVVSATAPIEALIESHGDALLDVAALSLRHGVSRGKPLPVESRDYPPPLGELGACFVTLHRAGELRGCIGTARPWRALVEDVAANAHGAGFEDPRFDPIAARELAALEMELSILGPPAPLPVRSEAELIAALVPGRDGLILAEGSRRGLFLPAVWDSLADPAEFVRHLKEKAGFKPSYWSQGIAVQRFETRTVARLGL